MSTTDRELLELAAKAAGLQVEWRERRTGRVAEFGCIKYQTISGFMVGATPWNPITDDGDALRLAVKLRLFPYLMLMGKSIGFDEIDMYIREEFEQDPYAATRRAIVRAAAAIGEKMP